ncbi:MAG: 6-phospho-beta-glucosidase, partial [Firmicutes bacterium]|nr:6-phospho-beta-glucosidase [Bacillota bacterium]
AIRVGQDPMRVLDERIPLRYGVLGQETTGPGGFAMALRTIPVLQHYAQIIRETAPQAWLLNFTNPAGMMTQAAIESRVNAVGICDSPVEMVRGLADFLQVPAADVHIQYAGLNHLGWASRVMVGAEDKTEEILSRYDQLKAGNKAFGAFDTQFIQRLGLLPNEYLYYYYSAREAVDHILQSGQTRGEQILALNQKLITALQELVPQGKLAQAAQVYAETLLARHQSYMQRETVGAVDEEAALDTSVLTQEDVIGGYAQVALGAARRLLGTAQGPLVLNVANAGAVQELDPTDVVEVTVTVDQDGMHPWAQGRLPSAVRGLVLSVKEYERLTVHAARTGDYAVALEALALHPLVPSVAVARKILDDYLREEREYLPQF